MAFEVVSRIAATERAVHARVTNADRTWDHLRTSLDRRDPKSVDACIRAVAREFDFGVTPNAAPGHVELVPSSRDAQVFEDGPRALDRISRILWMDGDFRQKNFGVTSVAFDIPAPDDALKLRYLRALQRSPLQEVRVGGSVMSRNILETHTIIIDPTDLDPAAAVDATINHLADLAGLGFVESAKIVMTTAEPFAEPTRANFDFHRKFLGAFGAHPRMQDRVYVREGLLFCGMLGLLGGVAALVVGLVQGNYFVAGGGFAGAFSGGAAALYAHHQNAAGAFDPLVPEFTVYNGQSLVARAQYTVEPRVAGAVKRHTPTWHVLE